MVPSHPERDRWLDPGTLTFMQRVRTPWQGTARAIIQGMIRRFVLPLPTAAQVLEIGAGDGQLRRWLPCELHPHLTHTEPESRFRKLFQRQHPEACVRDSNAYALPCAAESQTTVLALCVLDALHEPERAREEIRRVLKPGGLFLHFLDLGAYLATLFTELVHPGGVPLPCFLADTAALEQFTVAQRRALPTCDPFDDLALGRWDQLQWLLSPHGQPLQSKLAPYLKWFVPEQWDAPSAAQFYMELMVDRPRLLELNRNLGALFFALREQHPPGSPPPLTPFSTTRHVQRKLETLFSVADGFAAELSDIVAARERRPRTRSDPPDVRYHARLVGKSFQAPTVPEQSYGTPLARLTARAVEDTSATIFPRLALDSTLVVESNMLVFVARKL